MLSCETHFLIKKKNTEHHLINKQSKMSLANIEGSTLDHLRCHL